MKSLYIAALASLLATAAPAVTLDFSGNICNGGNACGGSAQLDQSYGDITGVDLTYDRNVDTMAVENVFVWGSGYEEFGNAIWTDVGAGMSVTLLADAGYEVSLFSLAIAPYANRVSNTQVRILDLASNLDVFDETFTPLSIDGSTTILANATSIAGFKIFFGPDAFNAGIGGLSYEANLVQDTPPVPLPAAGWMLIAGLGGLAAAKRKRR